MKISCPFDDQILPDLYTKASDVKVAEKPVVSFPFIIEEAPENTKTFAWTFVDYDSIPVCGFTFIHWVVANVPASNALILEDFARVDENHVHGKNSLASPFFRGAYTSIDEGYTGPCPPDEDHLYTLTVYALDCELPVKDGFYLNDLRREMAGHVLAKADIELVGRC